MTVQTTTLADFLLARIAEDEAVARAGEAGGVEFVRSEVPMFGARRGDEDIAVYLDRFDPARVLAECEAKRRIVEDLHEPYASEALNNSPACWHDGSPFPCPTLRMLALPYADHPDYREAWRP